MAKRAVPEINAGSMADIAFLLLIFFLVATTMDIDGGIMRKLPQKQDPNQKQEEIKIKQRNILEISINRNDQLMIENDYAKLEDVKELAMEFIDNGQNFDKKAELACSYCNGGPDGSISVELSDHPSKAVISLKTDRGSTYGNYALVEDALSQAYMELRNKASIKKYGVSYEKLLELKKINEADEENNEKEETIRKMYPQIISASESN